MHVQKSLFITSHQIFSRKSSNTDIAFSLPIWTAKNQNNTILTCICNITLVAIDLRPLFFRVAVLMHCVRTAIDNDNFLSDDNERLAKTTGFRHRKRVVIDWHSTSQEINIVNRDRNSLLELRVILKSWQSQSTFNLNIRNIVLSNRI